MAIKDLFKKVTKRVAESVTGEKEEEPFTEDFDKELETGTEEDLFKEAEEEKFPKKEEPAFGEELEEKPPTVPTEDLRGELEKIQNKLDLVNAHLKTIESKEDIFKIEAERYMQYFSFISEKIDHLERELAEVARLMKKKNTD